MFLRINDNITNTRAKDGDIGKSETIHIAEYSAGGLGNFENTVGLTNELFVRLSKTDVNRELLSKVGHIVEVLNNLKHFQVDMRDKSESEIVQETLAKFDTFNYQKLDTLDLSTDFKLFKARNIDEEESETYIKEGNSEEYYIFKEGDINRVSLGIITQNKTTRVISVLKDGEPQTIIDELIDGLKVISSVSHNRQYLKQFCFFMMTVDGLHREISVMIDHLKSTLTHILNSHSYRNNGYYGFDAFEIEKRLGFDLSKFLERTKNVASFQSGDPQCVE